LKLVSAASVFGVAFMVEGPISPEIRPLEEGRYGLLEPQES